MILDAADDPVFVPKFPTQFLRRVSEVEQLPLF